MSSARPYDSAARPSVSAFYWRRFAVMDDVETSLVLFQLAPMTYAALGMLVIPFVLYVIARWRSHRDQIVDPQLGIKVALSFFAVSAFQLVLAGVTIFLYAVISGSSSDAKSALYRFGIGLIVPAGIVLGAHLALLARTNQSQFPSVRRLFAGYNLLVTGVFGFIALVAAFESLFKRGSSHEVGRIAGAAVLVYGSAWAAVGVQFSRLVLDRFTAAGPPASMNPPSGPPSPNAPTKPETTGLPSLGAGAFPPIGQK